MDEYYVIFQRGTVYRGVRCREEVLAIVRGWDEAREALAELQTVYGGAWRVAFRPAYLLQEARRG